MTKRIYYLTSEIIPFAETYELAAFSKGVPNVFIERKHDFRLMMPKYGFISERRYILREVIRLRDMDLKFCGEDVQASVKSAFIPNTKVQVYFLENDSYYTAQDGELYNPQQSNQSCLNSHRFGYFASAALATLNYLRWKPEVIICNDWQTGLLPLFVHSNIFDKEYIKDVKILMLLHSKSDRGKYSLSEYKEVGLSEPDTTYAKDDQLDVLAAAIPYCDRVMVINRNEDLMTAYQQDPVFKKLFDQHSEKISATKLVGETQEDWEKMADEIIEVIDKL